MYRYREDTYEGELRHIFPNLDADQRRVLAKLVELAIRAIARADGAPVRCRRRDCRQSGECRGGGLQLDQAVCRAFLPDNAAEMIKAMLVYAELTGSVNAGKDDDWDEGDWYSDIDLPIDELIAEPRLLLPLGPFRIPLGPFDKRNGQPRDCPPLA
jgi:hypothetical protein